MANRAVAKEEVQANEERVVNALVAKLLDGLSASGTKQTTVVDALQAASRSGALTQEETKTLEKFFKSSSYPIEAQTLVMTERGWGITIDIEKMPQEWRDQYLKARSEKGGCGDGCACGGNCSCGGH